jgi:hypothetical protein
MSASIALISTQYLMAAEVLLNAFNFNCEFLLLLPRSFHHYNVYFATRLIRRLPFYLRVNLLHFNMASKDYLGLQSKKGFSIMIM